MSEIVYASYTQYLGVPGFLRRQWARMHLQCYPHVPRARELWRSKQAKALLCCVVKDGRLVAWAMYVWKPDRANPDLYTYTRRCERGKGHGKAVAAQARKDADLLWPNRPGATFYPHDPLAAALYTSLGYYDKKADKRTAVGV